MKYFPFLRGRQSELLALRDLAKDISKDGFVIPIIEPVKINPTTLKSINRFIEEEMPFLLICNPIHGKLSTRDDLLVNSELELALRDYEYWIPTLCVDTKTTVEKYEEFIASYCFWEMALIHYGKPPKKVVTEIEMTDIEYHVFLDKPKTPTKYKESISRINRVYIRDPFNRTRNKDYPQGPRSFTDMNTRDGNPQNINFGDFSIVGDYYSETGGPPYAIALHHIHLAEDSKCLEISHFLSDRRDTTADPSGKILEAVTHLVEALPGLHPNNTSACNEYREIYENRTLKSPAYMKRLAIKHHLEVIMTYGVLDLKF